MLYTFLPVTNDGRLYPIEDNINKYTPCIILSEKEYNGLLKLYNYVSRYEPSPVIREMLGHPMKLTKDYGKSLQAGDYVLYLYRDLSPKAASLIKKHKSVIRAFAEGICGFQHSLDLLSDHPAAMRFLDRHEEEVNLIETLFDATLPFCHMLGMI